MRRILVVARSLVLLLPLWTHMLEVVPPLSAAELQGPSAIEELITRGVLDIIRKEHLVQRELDDEMAGAAVDEFINMLDPDKLHFLKRDVEEFTRAKSELAQRLKRGDVSVAFRVYRRYQQRVEEARKVWRQLLGPDAEIDFTRDEVVIVESKAVEYSKDEGARSERWRLWVKYNLLLIKTAPDARAFDRVAACNELLGGREALARATALTTSDAVLEAFLNSVLGRFDTAMEYMSPASVENQRIVSEGSLVGIGATLQSPEHGGAIVATLVPGSPAEKVGLKPRDRIVSIGQGEDAEMVDITHLNLPDAVALIRGQASTRVRLRIVRPGDGSPRTFTIVRAKVSLPEAKVKGRVCEQTDRANGTSYKIGYLDMPSFYRDSSNGNSSAKDVHNLLKRFASQAVDLVVLDLRRCSAGTAGEMSGLAGLFLGRSPVLQYRTSDGRVGRHDNTDTDMAWSKGLVVLTSSTTAGGAEVVSAAIQDCHRGIVVGDQSTYGNSGFRASWPVAGEVVKTKKASNLGEFLATTVQVYRLSGDGIQGQGVAPDVVLPSLERVRRRTSTLAAGSHGIDRVPASGFPDYEMVAKGIPSLLRAASHGRRSASPDFLKLQNRMDWENSNREPIIVTLNEEKYRTQQKDAAPPSLPETKPGEPDYYLREVFAIASDYAGFLDNRTATPKGASAKRAATEDPAVVEKRLKDAKIADASLAVSNLEVRQRELNNELRGAKFLVISANLAYQKTAPGSVPEAFALAALVAAQGKVADVTGELDKVESELKAAGERYNRLRDGR